jgi:hypothetical protein
MHHYAKCCATSVMQVGPNALCPRSRLWPKQCKKHRNNSSTLQCTCNAEGKKDEAYWHTPKPWAKVDIHHITHDTHAHNMRVTFSPFPLLTALHLFSILTYPFTSDPLEVTTHRNTARPETEIRVFRYSPRPDAKSRS